jgi:hypothetical protein
MEVHLLFAKLCNLSSYLCWIAAPDLSHSAIEEAAKGLKVENTEKAKGYWLKKLNATITHYGPQEKWKCTTFHEAWLIDDVPLACEILVAFIHTVRMEKPSKEKGRPTKYLYHHVPRSYVQAINLIQSNINDWTEAYNQRNDIPGLRSPWQLLPSKNKSAPCSGHPGFTRMRNTLNVLLKELQRNNLGAVVKQVRCFFFVS